MTDSKSLIQHTAELGALVDKVLNQHRYSLDALDTRPKCSWCEKRVNIRGYRDDLCRACFEDSMNESDKQPEEENGTTD